MIDVFSVAALNRLLRTLPLPGQHIATAYFPLIQRDGTDEILFEVEQDKPRITPLVSPLVEGKVVDDYGSQVKSFRPAYAKDKRRFLPHGPLRRMPGETLGGELTPEQRRDLRIQRCQQDQLRMLMRRWEVMCSELMRTGQVTVTGDNYPTKVVNFERDAGLTVTLAGAARWGETGVDPYDTLQSWINLVLATSGIVSTRVTMDPLAFDLFAASEKVQKRMSREYRTNSTFVDDMRARGASSLDGQPQVTARYQGMIGDAEIWVYQDKYLDESGNEQKMLPDHTVIIGGDGAEGTKAYGAIQDEEAGYQSSDYFIKSWLEKDPAIRWMLLQCAPLPVLYRVNATLCATVR